MALDEKKLLEGKKIYVENLGCAKNQVDAEVMLDELADAGCAVVLSADEADVILVNTCAFIESARKEAVDTFFALRGQYPSAKVLVTGCLAQRYAKDLGSELTEADGVFGNRNLRQIADVVRRVILGQRVVETPSYPNASLERDHRRMLLGHPGSAYLKISEGCNHRCRYCAIPLIRGPLRSRPMEAVVSEASRLVGTGVKELNLIAQDLAAYGTDEPGGTSKFMELLRALVAIEGNFWIRLLYIHPDAFPAELPAFVAANPKVLPYFDLPFQHASAEVLRAMGRTGTSESYLALVANIRRHLPDAVFRSTLLLGFTGEQAPSYSDLHAFLEQATLDWVGMFLYSLEEGTPAWGDATTAELAKRLRRATKWQKELQTLQESISAERLARFVGKELDVLIEELVEGEDLAIGRMFGQAPEVDGLTVVMGRALVPGTVVRCGITRVNGIDLEAVPVGRREEQ